MTVLRCEVSANIAEMVLYGTVGGDFWSDGGITAEAVRQEILKLPEAVDTIQVYLNSNGGSVFEGMAIRDMLADDRRRVNVRIDGLAASIASVIAMAGDTVAIAENGRMMIHNAWGIGFGDKAEMRRTADLLDSIDKQLVAIYVLASGMAPSEIEAAMAAETWLTAEEAVEWGFVDEIADATRIAAQVPQDFAAIYREFKRAPEPSQWAKPSQWNADSGSTADSPLDPLADKRAAMLAESKVQVRLRMLELDDDEAG